MSSTGINLLLTAILVDVATIVRVVVSHDPDMCFFASSESKLRSVEWKTEWTVAKGIALRFIRRTEAGAERRIVLRSLQTTGQCSL